jgi:hypothetical protein
MATIAANSSISDSPAGRTAPCDPQQLSHRGILSGAAAPLGGFANWHADCPMDSGDRKPEAIFGDEPTGNLDSRSGTEVLEFMRRSVDELQQSIVLVTHDVRAAACADTVLLLAEAGSGSDWCGWSHRVLDTAKTLAG